MGYWPAVYGRPAWKGAPGAIPVAAGPAEGKFINWLTIKNQEASVVEDVVRIRRHPLVPAEIPIYGYVYDVHNGRLIEVPSATKEGRPQAAVTHNLV